MRIAKGHARCIPAVALITLFAGCPEPSSSGAGVTGSDAPALPETSFVYAQEVRSGVHHIMAFDLDTHTTTLVSTLDDDGASGTEVESLALSPDRAWVAFTAYFRIDPAELTGASGVPTQAIWEVSADGKTFRRISGPLPAPPSPACTVDLQCKPYGEICDDAYRHCALRATTRTLGVNSFTPDGATLVLQFDQLGLALDGTIVGGSSMLTIDAAGGAVMGATDVNGGCPVAIPGDVHDGQLLVMRGVGIGAGCDRDGVYALPFPPSGTGQPVVLGDPGTAVEFDVDSVAPRWFDDGSGFLFAGSEQISQHGLYTATPDGKRMALVAQFDGRLVDAIAVGGTPEAAIVETFTARTRARDLYRVDLATGAVQPLITDGNSSHPAF